MKQIKRLLALLNTIAFPLHKSISRYHKINKENFQDYCHNLTEESWQSFHSCLMNVLNQNGDPPFPIEEIDLQKEWDKIVENEGRRFVSSLKGVSLKGIVIHSHHGLAPAKGVMNLKYEKGKGASCSLFTVTPTSISFFQTPTGGLAISIRPPQSEGLMKNEPEVIVYRVFERLSDVCEYDLFYAMNFFLICAKERALWGKSTLLGRFYYLWITRIKAKVFPKLLSILEEKLKKLGL